MRSRKGQESVRAYTRIVRTTCAECALGCGVKAFVSDGALLDLCGDEGHPVNKGALCARAVTAVQVLLDPQRIRTPLLRERITQPFRSGSWSEAISFVRERLSEVRERYGPESLWIYPHARSFSSIALAWAFARSFGTPNVIHEPSPELVAIARSVLGVSAGFMTPLEEWIRSRVIMTVGPEIGSDVILCGWIIDARERGSRLIHLDGRPSSLASKSSLWLRARPGTETAVLRTMSSVLVEEGLAEPEALGVRVTGFNTWAERVRAYVPEEVAQYSWVPAEAIREAARTLARERPALVIGGGEDPALAHAAAALVILTGDAHRRGGGWNWLRTAFPFHALREKADHPRDPSTARALICEGERAFRADVRDVYQLELGVSLGWSSEDGGAWAHVHLPLATWLEEEGLSGVSHEPRLQWRNRVVPPPDGCKSCPEVWGLLAGAFGWQEQLPGWERGAVAPRKLADCFLGAEPSTVGLRSDLLDPETNPPGGLIWSRAEAFGPRSDLYLLPSGLPSSVWGEVHGAGGEVDARFPFVLLQDWTLAALGPDVSRRQWTAEAHPGKAIIMAPAPARLLGLRDGDRAVLESASSAIEAPIALSERVDPRALVYRTHDPVLDGDWVDGTSVSVRPKDMDRKLAEEILANAVKNLTR